MTTGTNIRDRALRPMRDSAQEMFPDTELIEYMNDALVDLAVRERLIHEETTIAPASGTLGLAVDMIRIRWVVAPDGIEAHYADPSTFKHLQEYDPSRSEEQRIYSVWDTKIWLLPAPANGSGSWSIGYYGLPTAIAAIGDTIPLTRIWDAKLVHYLRAQCYYRLGEEGLGDREIAEYYVGLHDRIASFDQQQPGEINFAMALGVIDIDPDARHI